MNVEFTNQKKSLDQINELLSQTFKKFSSSECSLAYCFKVIYENITQDILKLLFDDYIKLFYRCISSKDDEAIYWCLKVLLFSVIQINGASFLTNLDYSVDGFEKIAISRACPCDPEDSSSLRKLFIDFYFNLVHLFDDQIDFLRKSELLWRPIYAEIANDNLKEIKSILNHTQGLSRSCKYIILNTLTLNRISSILLDSSNNNLQEETENYNDNGSDRNSKYKEIDDKKEFVTRFLIQNEAFNYSSIWFKGLKPLTCSAHRKIILSTLNNNPDLIKNFLSGWVSNKWEPEVSNHFVQSSKFLVEIYEISHDPFISSTSQMMKVPFTKGLLHTDDQTVVPMTCNVLLAYLGSIERHVMELEMMDNISERDQFLTMAKSHLPDIKTVINVLGKYSKQGIESSTTIESLIVAFGYYSKYFGRMSISIIRSITNHASIIKIVPNLILNDLWKKDNNYLMEMVDCFFACSLIDYYSMIRAVLRSSQIFPADWVDGIIEFLESQNDIESIRSFMNAIKTFRCNQTVLPDDRLKLLKHFGLPSKVADNASQLNNKPHESHEFVNASAPTIQESSFSLLDINTKGIERLEESFCDHEHAIITLVDYLKKHFLHQIEITDDFVESSDPFNSSLFSPISDINFVSKFNCGSWCQILASILSINMENSSINPILDARTIISSRILIFPLYYLCSSSNQCKKVGKYLLERFISFYLTRSTIKFRQKQQILLLFSVLQTTLRETKTSRLDLITAIFTCEACRALMIPDHPMYKVIIDSLCTEPSFNPPHSNLVIFKVIAQNHKEINSDYDDDKDRYWNRIKWSLRIIEAGIRTIDEVRLCYNANLFQNIATISLVGNNVIAPIVTNIIKRAINIVNNNNNSISNQEDTNDKDRELKIAINSLTL